MRQVPVLIDTAKGGTSDGLGGDWGGGGVLPSGAPLAWPPRSRDVSHEIGVTQRKG